MPTKPYEPPPPTRVRLRRTDAGYACDVRGFPGDAIAVEVERDGDEWVEPARPTSPRPRWHPTLDAFRERCLDTWVRRWANAAGSFRADERHRDEAHGFLRWLRERPEWTECGGVREGGGATFHDACCDTFLGNLDGAALTDLYREWTER